MKKPVIDEASADYQNMIDLLAVYSEASNQLKELEAEVNTELLAEMDVRRRDYARLQEALTKADTALNLIALQHPEWFELRKSIKTPYGTVKFTSSTTLVADNEEVSIVLIEARAEKDNTFKVEDFIRSEKSLNLEALESLTDSALAAFRIQRVKNENFKVIAASIDMGKAIKEAVTEGAV